MGEDDQSDAAKLRHVIEEARAELVSDRWRLLLTPSTAPRLHAAAGLAHCCVLAQAMLDAHDRDDELVGRLLARSLYESWLTAYYLHHGGMAALEAVGAAYSHTVARQQRAFLEHDQRLTSARLKARKRNKAIARTNAHLARFNEQHPEDPKPLLDAVSVPPGVMSDWVSQPTPKFGDTNPRPLSLREIIDRLQALTRDAGKEETFELSYHYAYRSLSYLGAHVSLFVLDAYLDDRQGQAVFVRVLPTASVPSSFSDANIDMALLLVSALSLSVLEESGGSSPKAREVMDVFASRYDNAMADDAGEG